MNSDPRRTGHGPDNLGDEEQDAEVAQYEYYIEDPPDDLVIAEDDDDDAEEATDWAARHPHAAEHDEEPEAVELDDEPTAGNEPAEQAAMHEIREE
jgi:hypothetical protein